jgi:sulfate transport system ATP-binding protein
MSIILDNLTKQYGDTPAVNGVSLRIADGECFVLLGPSGSGKSTILRMIAGLVPVDAGRVVLHGRDATHLVPQAREIGFVFQNYALFPHMTVGENIEFGLRARGVAPAERHHRRDELLDLVGLGGYAGRLPKQLSGGQQQRVALARALAPNPAILLLDEPFGALDAQIRAELRVSLRRIQRELAITTIFVTHDQAEAFELADRLGVMCHGDLLEVGAPREVYLRPQEPFTATFLGSANIWWGEIQASIAQAGAVHLPLVPAVSAEFCGQRAQIMFRPEDVTLAPTLGTATGTPLGAGHVERITFVGTGERLRVRMAPLPGVHAVAPPPDFSDDAVLLDVERTQHQAQAFPLQVGDIVWAGVQRVHPLLRHSVHAAPVTPLHAGYAAEEQPEESIA